MVRPHAAHLTGIDLSVGMLERARERGVYDQLIEAELGAYLERCPRTHDVIAASDGFIYLGCLERVIASARRALVAGGLIATHRPFATKATTLSEG